MEGCPLKLQAGLLGPARHTTSTTVRVTKRVCTVRGSQIKQCAIEWLTFAESDPGLGKLANQLRAEWRGETVPFACRYRRPIEASSRPAWPRKTHHQHHSTRHQTCMHFFSFLTNDPRFLRVDIAHCSPPCQTWSPAHTVPKNLGSLVRKLKKSECSTSTSSKLSWYVSRACLSIAGGHCTLLTPLPDLVSCAYGALCSR
jgi:hypothetical protein